MRSGAYPESDTMMFRFVFLALAVLLTASAATSARVEILDGDNYDLVASTSRGLRLRFKDPDLVFRVGGRVHADAAFFDSDATNINSDVKLRRGRVYLSGRIFEDFGFKVERELAPSRGEWRNVWVSYAPMKLNTHRITTDMWFPYLIGFVRPPILSQTWWKYVDVDIEAQKKFEATN